MQKRHSVYELKQPASYDPSTATLSYSSDGRCTAVLGAMTKAMQAERMLVGASVRVQVVKVSSTQAGGCVYGVSYACAQESRVRKILSNAGISVRKYMT